MTRWMLGLAALSLTGAATAAEWQYVAMNGVAATSIAIEPAQSRLLVGTLEGFWVGDIDSGVWSSRDEPGMIGRQVWALAGHPDHDLRVVTGRENAFFKGYLEVSEDLGTSNNVAYSSPAGRIMGLVRHPSQADVMFACTWSDIVDGEVIRSTNGGVSWTGLTGTIHHQMTDVDVGPTGTVFVSGSSLMTRSLDGGATWHQTADGLPPAYGVYTVAAHPTDALQLLACNDLGLYRSADGGDSWVLARDGACRAIAWGWSCGVGDDDRLVAVVEWDGRVLLSADGGTTWGDTSAPEDPVDLVFSVANESLYVATAALGVWRSAVCPSTIFADGFESGDVSAWTEPGP